MKEGNSIYANYPLKVREMNFIGPILQLLKYIYILMIGLFL